MEGDEVVADTSLHVPHAQLGLDQLGAGGVRGRAVPARVQDVAGGEENAGVAQLKLPRTKVGDVGTAILLSTMLSTFVYCRN